MPPLTPRTMIEADLPAIQDLWVAAWQATLPAENFPARRAWLSSHLARLHEAGAETLCLGAPEAFLTWFPATGLVEQLAVHPARFGHGLATTLLAAAKQVRPAGLHLLVNQENPRAIAFYQREGFVIAEATTNPGGTRPVWRMRWPAESACHN